MPCPAIVQQPVGPRNCHPERSQARREAIGSAQSKDPYSSSLSQADAGNSHDESPLHSLPHVLAASRNGLLTGNAERSQNGSRKYRQTQLVYRALWKSVKRNRNLRISQ